MLVARGGNGDAPVRISKSLINSLVPAELAADRLILWDAQVKGFGLRVYRTGRIVYVLQYRMKGAGAKTRTATIGTHGSPWTPGAARQRALALLEQVRLGVDPGAQEKRAAEEESAREAAEASAKEEAERWDFDAFLDRYVQGHVRANELRSLKDIEGTFDRDVRPAFRGRSVLSITKQEIKDLRVRIGKRSRSAANKAHKWMSAAFMWGIEHDGLTTTPMLGLKKPFPEPKRKRFLSDREIALVWSVLVVLERRFAMVERLLILLGQRLREVAGMRWSEIDLDAGVWIIPGERTKNKRDHLVPLVPVIVRLLESVEPDPSKRRGLVFTTTGTTPVSGFSKSKAEIDAAVAAAGVTPAWSDEEPPAHWVRHDHRRTVSTGFGRLGIPLAHAEAVLNHSSGELSGVAGTYWLYEYAAEKRAALERWAEHVESVLAEHGLSIMPS